MVRGMAGRALVMPAATVRVAATGVRRVRAALFGEARVSGEARRVPFRRMPIRCETTGCGMKGRGATEPAMIDRAADVRAMVLDATQTGGARPVVMATAVIARAMGAHVRTGHGQAGLPAIENSQVTFVRTGPVRTGSAQTTGARIVPVRIVPIRTGRSRTG